MYCATFSSAEHTQRLEMLGSLTCGIAHDLNNMLAIVEGYASLADRTLPRGHAAHDSLDTIGDAARRGLEMVRQIMTFGRPGGERALGQLRGVIEGSLKLLRSTVPGKIQLCTDLAQSVPDIEMDAGQLSQVIMNLCINASHAIGTAPGKITLAVTQAELDAKPYVRLAIGDDGCGMSAATRERIFEPYFTTKQPGKGTGLGLSVVRDIVAAHGGSIAVCSQIGAGTTFDIYLPTAPQSIARATNRSVRSSVHRIMYIDDDQPMTELMKELLEGKGYEVETFNDPQNALLAFCAFPAAYDLIVADVNMPGLGGFDLARKMRVIEHDLPIVLTSGWVDATVQATAQAAGVGAVLHKSIDVLELSETLHRICAGTPHGDATRLHS